MLQNLNWPKINNIIIEGSWSGKTKSIFDLIGYQPDIDRICLYAKDPSKG